MREGDTLLERVAVCGGAGGDFLIPLLQEGGAGAAVTGELKHHEWLALPSGVTMVEAGHYHTEICMAEGMARWLREAFPSAEVTVFPGEPPYGRFDNLHMNPPCPGRVGKDGFFMALDGALLRCIKEEMEACLCEARVDKIHQPSREELILTLRQRSGTHKLYISAQAASPRIHFTGISLENPSSPPMFCMLLRKRITGGRLIGIRQEGLERALYLDLDCLDELGT